MHGIKTLIDDLDLIGHPLNDGEIMVHTLNGLVYEYSSLNGVILCTKNPFTIPLGPLLYHSKNTLECYNNFFYIFKV